MYDRRGRALLGVALVLAAGLAAFPAGAAGHASLLETSPRPGARLAAAPARIVLTYTEPLNARLTTARLVAADGNRPVRATMRVQDGRRLALRPARRLAQGAYRLAWRSVSTIDGHIREGTVGFGIGTAPTGAAVTLEQDPLDGWGPARVAARILLYAALVVFAGGLFAAALLRDVRPGAWLVPPRVREALAAGGADPDDVIAAAERRSMWAGWVAAAAAVIVVAIETIDTAGGVDAGRAQDFLFSSRAGVSRVLLVAGLVIAAALWRRLPRAGAAIVAAAVLALPLGGHAGAADPRVVAVWTDWAHLLAAAVWMGGIAHIAAAWLPALRSGDRRLRQAVLHSVLPRFGRIALPAFVLVAATGLWNALIELGGVAELWTTGYGRVLATKIALVALVATASWIHAFRLRPVLQNPGPGLDPPRNVEAAHRRLLGAEPMLGIGVLAAAAVLVAFPVPPREAGAAAEAFGAVRACDPCPFAKPEPRELAAAAPVGDLTAAVWLRREGGEVAGTLRIIDGKRRPARVRATVTSARTQRPCGTGCWHLRAARADELEVTVHASGNRRTVRLPARWIVGDEHRARALLRSAQQAMRALRSYRMVEVVRSAAAADRSARTYFAFRSPDRMRYRTAFGTSVVVGSRGWIRPADAPWQEVDQSEDFRVAHGFRWTIFEATARLLAVRREHGRRVAELAFVDYGYPVWYRVTLDLDTRRALRATLTTPENRIEDRFHGFGVPIAIDAPPAA